jgi:hypothetical protein
MNTRNTKTKTNSDPLFRAQMLVEALSSTKSTALLKYLLEHGQASSLELTIHTGFDSDALEHHLDLLLSHKLILLKTNVIEGNWYEPNLPYLSKVSGIIKQLASFHA